MSRATRRSLLAGLAGWAAVCAGTGRAAPAAAGLDILLAPTTASILVARLVASGDLTAALPGATVHPWHDPDELRAAVIAERSAFFTAPTHVIANLANRGLPIKLLAVIGMGHIGIVTRDPKVTRLADLVGRPITGFFRNDMPDLVFRAVARMDGLDPDKDFALTYVGTPMEAAQMLASGRVETALLAEPSTSAAIMMARQQNRVLYRAISLQEIWIRHRGGAGIPMVALGLDARLLEAAPALRATLHDALPKAKAWVETAKDEAAALAEAMLHMKQAIARVSLDHVPLTLVSGTAARADLEAFYGVILGLAPQALSGRLPAADFYLDL